MDNLDLLPSWFPKDALSAIATLAAYEKAGLPVIMDNGAKMYPEGWLRWLKMESDE